MSCKDFCSTFLYHAGRSSALCRATISCPTGSFVDLSRMTEIITSAPLLLGILQNWAKGRQFKLSWLHLHIVAIFSQQLRLTSHPRDKSLHCAHVFPSARPLGKKKSSRRVWNSVSVCVQVKSQKSMCLFLISTLLLSLKCTNHCRGLGTLARHKYLGH